MIDLAFRDIWQRKTRSVLTVLGVGLAVMLYVYLSTIMSFYDRDLERTIAGLAGKVVVQSSDDGSTGYPPLDSLIPVSTANDILAMPEVDRVRSSPVLFESIVSNPAPNMPPSVMAVGIEPGHEIAFTGIVPVNGADRLEHPDQALMGASAASHYSAAVGEVVTIKGREFEVVGVFAEETEVVNNAVLIPLETAQEIFARPTVVSGVLITAERAESVNALASGIEASIPGVSATTSTEMASVTDELMGPQRAFFATLRGTLIAVGVVVVMVVMIMAVGERKREFGTLKALGAGRRQVLSLVLWESIALSLAGGVGATIAAWLLTRGESMTVDAALAAQAIFIAVLVGALASLWPAWSALRVDPVESLRHE